MKYKKSILILFLAIFLLSIASASAGDANDTIIAGEDNTPIISTDESTDIITATNETQVIAEANNEEIIKDSDDTTFYALDQLIQNGQGTIKLKHDYEYEGSGYTDGITIAKQITIDGQGHTIDAKNQARIFNILNRVTLKNITFINGNATSGNGGGAINWLSNQGSVTNCRFVNNNADNLIGGAIYLAGGNSRITDCRFVNNNAMGGGAVYYYGDNGIITNSIFESNSNSDIGGAIYWEGTNGIVTNSTFERNSASTVGGAIFWTGTNGIVTNSTFENNSAKLKGGAISWRGSNGKIYGSTFISNFIDSNNEIKRGGAIEWYRTNNGTISNCSFMDNYITGDAGGAVYCDGCKDVQVSDCRFMNNNAIIGGAICYYNCNRGQVSKSTFTNNNATDGSAIEWYESENSQVSNCNFTDNYASNSAAVTWYGGNNGQISGSNFINNNAQGGSSIVLGGIIGSNISNCTFRYNTADTGGAIYSATSQNVIVCNCVFESNVARTSGGAIHWARNNNVTVSDCIFVNNINIDEEYGGSAMYFYKNNYTLISNCSFERNSASGRGALFFAYELGDIVNKCSFLYNFADYDGSAITSYYNKNLKINNNLFMHNDPSCDIYFKDPDDNSNIDYNWYGNTESNIRTGPDTRNIYPTTWLYLTAEANPDTISVLNTSDIVFKLKAYNINSGTTSEYNNTLFKKVNLEITSTRGNVDKNIVSLGDTVKYTASRVGIGIITAEIEDISYTINVLNKADPKLYVGSQIPAYSNNIPITLNYNSGATGKVDIILTGKKYNKTFTNVDLNTEISLGKLNIDEYEVTVYYSGDDNFINEIATGTLIVNDDPKIIASDFATPFKDDYLPVTLVNSQYNPISGAKLLVDLNGITTYTTDANGQIKISTENLTLGTYTAKITFNGNENQNKTNKTVKITILTPKLRFKDLNELIATSTDGNIYLNDDYAFDPKSDNQFINGIRITKTVILHGNNHSIDGNGKARIFYVHADNVAFENITFTNANNNLNGGAIYLENSKNSSVSKCIFVNNSAEEGGAIAGVNSPNALMIDCIFKDNTAYSGSAISIQMYSSNGRIYNCTFVNNSAEDMLILWNGDNLNISKCRFVNNSASVTYLLNIARCSNYSICDSVFENNSVKDNILNLYGSANGIVSNCSFIGNHADNGAGAIELWKSDNVQISDCNFENNYAGQEGGAIYVTQSANVQISNSNFVNNSAQRGAAIYWRGDYGNVFNCTFIDNVAIANNPWDINEIIIWDSNNGNVSSCVFINNTATITVNLDNDDDQCNFKLNNNIFLNNEVDYEIYADNADDSSNADYNWFGNDINNYENGPNTYNLNPKVWLFLNPAANPDTITLIDTSDIAFKLDAYNNNSGAVSSYDNTLLKDVELPVTSSNGNVDKNMATLGETIVFTPTNMGIGSVSAVIENVEYTVYLNIDKANPNLSVESQEVTYGENTIVINYNGLATGKVDITLTGKNNNYHFTDMELNTAVLLDETINSDKYAVTVTYSGDDKFYGASAGSTLKVNKAIPEITVSANDAGYGNDLIVRVKLPSDATRRPTVTIADQTKAVTMRNGAGTVKFSGLDVGTYDIVATYNGDANYGKVSANTTAKINPLPEITVSANDVGYGHDLVVTVKLPSDASRRPTVTIADQSKLVTMRNGVGTVKFSGLDVGTYDIVATYNGDANYGKVSANTTAKVNPLPEITVTANDITCGEDLVVTVQMPADATRRPTVTIGDETKLVTMRNGAGSVKFSGLDLGTHKITVSYNGDSNYGKTSVSTTVKVNRGPAEISVEAAPVNYGETAVVNIQLPSDVTRRATVTIGNETKTVSLTNGAGTAEFTGLTAGTHTATVTYNGDDKYLKSSVNATVKVNKATPDIQITADDISYGETLTVGVQLPSDVTKRALVTIDGVSKYASLTNGAGSVKFTGLSVGTHDIEVSYAGDANYKKASSTTTITVKQ